VIRRERDGFKLITDPHGLVLKQTQDGKN
jgi:hypothetical protein